MNQLIEALNQAGIATEGLDLSTFLENAGYDAENLTAEDITEIVNSLSRGGKAKSGTLAKPAKTAGVSRRGRKAAAAPTAAEVQTAQPAADVAGTLNAINDGQSALVEGFVNQTVDRAETDAYTMLQAAYGMTPLTLNLLAQGLNAGVQGGHFDPDRFRQLGASLAGAAGAFGGDAEAD